MKSLFLLVISCLAALSVFAQTTASTVTITSTSNRAREILVDDKSYTIAGNTETSTAATNAVVITDLEPGQHTLQIVRNWNNNANSNSSRNKTTFTLRSGFDLQITINRDGSVQQKEIRIGRGFTGTAMRTPVSDASFNVILKDVKKQRTITSKTAAVKKAFNKKGNYFTTDQAKQLIELVSTQSGRLSLAKLSYPTITDPDNFTDMESLLNEANQDALALYVDDYKIKNQRNTNPRNTNTDNNTGSTTSGSGIKKAMANDAFNSLYRDIEREWRADQKMLALTNAFTNTSNYFSTNQAGRLIQLVSNENDRLQLAKASYRSITDPTNFKQINELLSSQASRDALTAYVNWYTGTSNTGTVSTVRTPMSTTNFNKLLNDVKDEWMPGAKMTMLTTAFANANNYFSVHQAGQLIQLVSDEENRLTLAKSAYRNITDPANFPQLYQLFNYQSSRDALAAHVKSQGGTTGSGSTGQFKTPMSDANYNQLMSDVKAQWLPFGKMSALTTIFANPEYYFTSMQAKGLIQLVSDEDNRLQLAKSSYRNITDRANFTLLYDLFTDQAIKDALASYVSSYRDSAGF